jgi:glycosyltransferase involved in cell wall biosynthesis
MTEALNPDVSVIIPARNRAELVARALRSVHKQESGVCDIILVDDASDVPLETSLPDDLLRNVRVFRNATRCNAAYSRNRGVESARGKYLAFLDSDDVWFPSHLRLAVACLEAAPRNTLYVSRFGAKEVIKHGPADVHYDGYKFLFERIGDPRSSALVVSRDFFESVQGFDQSLEKYQDWDFALRCAGKGELRLNKSTTVFLDDRAADRMSSRTDFGATRAFLARHAGRMSKRHLSRFFATLLITSAMQNDAKEHRKAVAVWHDYLTLRSFPIRYWPLLCCQRIGLGVTKTWLSFRRLRQHVVCKISHMRAATGSN